MRGKINIEDYKIRCVIGVYPHERKIEQELGLDLEIEYDISSCVKSDHLSDAINYSEIIEVCKKVAQENQFHLIETFGAIVLERIFKEFNVLYVKVRVNKKGAIPYAKQVSVEVEKRV